MGGRDLDRVDGGDLVVVRLREHDGPDAKLLPGAPGDVVLLCRRTGMGVGPCVPLQGRGGGGVAAPRTRGVLKGGGERNCLPCLCFWTDRRGLAIQQRKLAIV